MVRRGRQRGPARWCSAWPAAGAPTATRRPTDRPAPKARVHARLRVRCPRSAAASSTVPNAGTANVHVEVTVHGRCLGRGGRRAATAVTPCGSPPTPAPPGAPAAVLVATDEGSGALDPGAEAFTFGATFQLDEKSSGSEADNGDNLVQRGTFDSPGQLKIQLDHDVPSCRVKGGRRARSSSRPTAPMRPGRLVLRHLRAHRVRRRAHREGVRRRRRARDLARHRRRPGALAAGRPAAHRRRQDRARRHPGRLARPVQRRRRRRLPPGAVPS